MKIRHELVVVGECPVNGSRDQYELVVECDRVLPVELIIEACAHAVEMPRFQESVTELVWARLGDGVVVTSRGTHSGVLTTVTCGGES